MSLEQHLADFLIGQEAIGLGPYCRKCLEFWESHYGEDTARKVQAILKNHYGKKKLATSAGTASAP